MDRDSVIPHVMRAQQLRATNCAAMHPHRLGSSIRTVPPHSVMQFRIVLHLREMSCKIARLNLSRIVRPRLHRLRPEGMLLGALMQVDNKSIAVVQAPQRPPVRMLDMAVAAVGVWVVVAVVPEGTDAAKHS
jgi:hypothetical protein